MEGLLEIFAQKNNYHSYGYVIVYTNDLNVT